MSMQKGAKNGQNAQSRIHMWKAEKISWLWPRVALSWKIFGSKHLVMIKMTFKDMVAWWQHSWAGNNAEKWQKIIFRTNNWKARKSGKMGFWWPHEAFLPWIFVLQHTWISFHFGRIYLPARACSLLFLSFFLSYFVLLTFSPSLFSSICFI